MSREPRDVETMYEIQREKAKEDIAEITSELDAERNKLGMHKRPAIDEPYMQGDVDPLR